MRAFESELIYLSKQTYLFYKIRNIQGVSWWVRKILGDDSLSKIKEGFSYKHILLYIIGVYVYMKNPP